MRANDFVESYMDFNYYALSRNRLRLCCCSSSPIKSFLQFRAHERVNERIEEFLLSLKIWDRWSVVSCRVLDMIAVGKREIHVEETEERKGREGVDDPGLKWRWERWKKGSQMRCRVLLQNRTKQSSAVQWCRAQYSAMNWRTTHGDVLFSLSTELQYYDGTAGHLNKRQAVNQSHITHLLPLCSPPIVCHSFYQSDCAYLRVCSPLHSNLSVESIRHRWWQRTLLRSLSRWRHTAPWSLQRGSWDPEFQEWKKK